MADNELEAIESLAKILSEIDQNKLWIIAIVIIVIIVSHSLKWYFAWKSKQRIEQNLSMLSKSLSCLSDHLGKHEFNSEQRTSGLDKIMAEIRDRQRNVIGHNDSIKIIINKFNDVIENEVIKIFEWSIINNDYESRKDFVRKKIKTKIAEQISLAKESLGQFNLSVDLGKFFITYKDEKSNNIHFKIVDQIWDNVEKVYHKENYSGNVVEQQLEEMQVEINNVITTELMKIQVDINNLYINQNRK